MSKHIPNIQPTLDELAKRHEPPKPLPQMKTPPWKEGSAEWCREMKTHGQQIARMHEQRQKPGR